MDKKDPRDLAIEELKRLIEQYANAEKTPRAVGGPYSLTPKEMLREVENNTEIGKKFIETFNSLRQQFPQI